MPRGATSEQPAGLEYRADFVTEDEERQLVELIERLDFREVTMHGQTALRTVRHYGYDYDYEHYGRVVPAEPLPAGLEWLRDRCAAFAGLAAEELVQALVSRYPPGAPIGWHRDAPMFGAKVHGLSLGAMCVMRFQRKTTDGVRETARIALEPRSGYVLAGKARTSWQHSIPPTKELRYSLTFRTLRA